MKGLRIGYLNVQGLRKDKWKRGVQLLRDNFDYLFLAETWFMNHEVYQKRQEFIISSLDSRAPKLKGRDHGGLYLLGTRNAQSRVKSVKVSEYGITFTCGSHLISGVYFPPYTMHPDQMETILQGMKKSTIVMGDINTRFKDPTHQSGNPGPPLRIKVMDEFCDQHRFQHVKPVDGGSSGFTSGRRLTTDHCFVSTQIPTEINLELWDTTRLKFPTDHDYLLNVSLGSNGSEPAQMVEKTIHRFRVSQLSRSEQVDKLVRWIEENVPEGVWDGREKDVDQLNDGLVQICQQAQRQTIGERQQDQRRGKFHPRRCRTLPRRIGKDPLNEGDDPNLSRCLYRRALRHSAENGVILPTPEARRRGIDAMAESLRIWKERWSSDRTSTFPVLEDLVEGAHGWTREEIVDEIDRQDAAKACGADGIHIKFLKAVKGTKIVLGLQQLFTQCMWQGRTPRAWNRSEIELITKDLAKPRDSRNLRPISLIPIFRKLFERLLLLRYSDGEWAKLHPGQAGFRHGYSTYTNAAMVHEWLSSGSRKLAVFLDLKSAFDVVDYQLLDEKLRRRGCPQQVLRLIRSLMFTDIQSRLQINGQITSYFQRTRGVLQGSPLSPWLFNLFIDDLLQAVNPPPPQLPDCLFYADDGVLIPALGREIPKLLAIVEDWTLKNRIALNVGKCGILTRVHHREPLRVYGEEIPYVDQYMYLGFPMRKGGIDFERHLEQRTQAVVGRLKWLQIFTNSWCSQTRLEVFKQYFQPMMEYGGPLVIAWMRGKRGNRKKEVGQATRGLREIMMWIADAKDRKWHVMANLCGLTNFETRLEHLFTRFQLVLRQMDISSPLRRMLHRGSTSDQRSFTRCLGQDTSYTEFLNQGNFEPNIRTALQRFIQAKKERAIYQEGQSTHLTRLIPMTSRIKLRDRCLTAPLAMQKVLLQYRRGQFAHNKICACNTRVTFRRGHEGCAFLDVEIGFSRKERRRKHEMRKELGISKVFTDIDFLINVGRVKDAFDILIHIEKKLGKVWHQKQQQA